MATYDTQPLPTLRQLGKATSIAIGVAAVILITTVLPAEYGVDPTGVGKLIGLVRLNPVADATASPAPDAAALAAAVPAAAVIKSDIAMRSDEMSVTLAPNESAEVKAPMRKGDQFVFSWVSQGGEVKSDMHGEPSDGSKEASYWKSRQQASGQGSFVAPFDGTHGWYWRNRGESPVTVTVKVSGFYEKLYRPK
jgi:hypothetical protein